MTPDSQQIASIRTFNRFYTRIIGLLDDGIMKSPYSLGEARIIHEIGKLDRTTSAVLARLLGMDPGQLSRLLGRLSERGVLDRVPSGEDGRAVDLVLTPEGAAACADLNALSDAAAEALIAPLAPRATAGTHRSHGADHRPARQQAARRLHHQGLSPDRRTRLADPSPGPALCRRTGLGTANSRR